MVGEGGIFTRESLYPSAIGLAKILVSTTPLPEQKPKKIN